MAFYINNKNAPRPQTPMASSPCSSSMKIGSATSTTSTWVDIPQSVSSRKMSFSSAVICRHSNDVPSAYISDEDLFGGDHDEPYLTEPPPPPRSAEVWLAKPLLPPVASTSPRRSVSKKSPKKITKPVR